MSTKRKRRPPPRLGPGSGRRTPPPTAQRQPTPRAQRVARSKRGAGRGPTIRRRRLRTMTVSVAGAVVLAGVITLAVVDHGSSAGYNTAAQRWVLPRLGEPGKVSLASLHGRPVVVNFFASWCTVCASELPVFAQDARALRGEVDVVEVNALETGNGQAFAEQYDLGSSVTAVLRDVGGSQGDGLYQALGGTGSMPMTAFYSSSGKLLTTHVGGFTASTLSSELHQLYGLSVPA